MSVIKDSEYWKDYNERRKAKGYFQQNYLQRKEQVVKNGEEVVKNPANILQPNQVVKVVKNESLQPKIELELLSELESNNLTEEEKQIALKVIRMITSKNKKDKNLIINYHVLYSKPSEEDKDEIIAKLQEEAKMNRKIITEYMNLKENYYQQIVELKKPVCRV